MCREIFKYLIISVDILSFDSEQLWRSITSISIVYMSIGHLIIDHTGSSISTLCTQLRCNCCKPSYWILIKHNIVTRRFFRFIGHADSEFTIRRKSLIKLCIYNNLLLVKIKINKLLRKNVRYIFVISGFLTEWIPFFQHTSHVRDKFF